MIWKLLAEKLQENPEEIIYRTINNEGKLVDINLEPQLLIDEMLESNIAGLYHEEKVFLYKFKQKYYI